VLLLGPDASPSVKKKTHPLGGGSTTFDGEKYEGKDSSFYTRGVYGRWGMEGGGAVLGCSKAMERKGREQVLARIRHQDQGFGLRVFCKNESHLGKQQQKGNERKEGKGVTGY